MHTVRETPSDQGYIDPAPAANGGARVLHVINGEHYAGAERVQDLLAAQLVEMGWGVELACLKPGRFGEMRHARHVPLHETPMRGRFDLLPVKAIAGLIRERGFTIVHSHTPRSALMASLAAKQTGAIHVYHLHSPTAVDSTHLVRNWINARVERFSLRGVAAVIPVSESLGRYAIAKGLHAACVKVVHNGVPTCGSLVPRETPTKVWTLGMMALFRPRKGLEVLLDAVAELRRRGFEIRLNAIGGFETEEYERSVRALARTLDLEKMTDWRGFQRDVNAELARLDLFVLPSLFGEGLPMVVLEAMAAGIPLVGTRVEGVPEAVRDGVDGVICEPRDPMAMADAVERVISGQVDWQSLRANAHHRQAERFSDRSMADGVASVYKQVLAQRAAEPSPTQL